MFKMTYCRLRSVMLDIQWVWKRTNFGIKNSLTSPSLAKIFFNSLRDGNVEPI